MNDARLSENELDQLPREVLVKLILGLQSSMDELNHTVQILSEQIKVMNQRQYGRKTESSSQIYMPQLELGINEPEALADESEPEPSLEEAVSRHPRPKGKRETDFQKITKHREEIIELKEAELDDRFGKDHWKRLPYQIITKLEHFPASFEAVTYKIGVYAADDNQTILRAPKPAELWPNSIATPSLVSSIIFGKYVNAVPLYRQEKAYEESSICISRTTMANWMIAASEQYLRPFYALLKKEMLEERLLHADETPFEVARDGRPAGSKSYMWVYSTGRCAAKRKAILYDYRHTRSHEHPDDFLRGFRGALVCDGYQAYHRLGKDHPEEFVVAGCWVHLKRKFSTLIKAEGVKAAKGTLAESAVERISRICHEDHLLKELSSEERLQKRQQIIKPLVNEFFEWVKESRQYVAEQSETGKGFTYAMNQEPYLRAFLTDPDIPMDNNQAERAIRPFTVGRKNWVMIDTPKGAEASAVLYSIVETAKANNLKIYDYFTYLLTELPKYCNNLNTEIPQALLPWSDELPLSLRK